SNLNSITTCRRRFSLFCCCWNVSDPIDARDNTSTDDTTKNAQASSYRVAAAATGAGRLRIFIGAGDFSAEILQRMRAPPKEYSDSNLNSITTCRRRFSLFCCCRNVSDPIDPRDNTSTDDTTKNAQASSYRVAAAATGAGRLRIFIVFYSMYGHVEGIARRLNKGVGGIE
ncbi:hypothetical protein HN51_020799, partial [Arachis hypogaea]